MNTDPLWQPLLWLGIGWFIFLGLALLFSIPNDDATTFGCALIIILPAVTLILSAIYLFWYLHVTVHY